MSDEATPNDEAELPAAASDARPTERELDEIALFLTVARRGDEPGPESWLYVAPPVAAPRLAGRRGLVGSSRSAVG